VPTVIEELCSGCGLCWRLCPHRAIGIKQKVIGKIFENQVDGHFWLVTGRTQGVVEESGPVVTAARDYGLELAKSKQADYLLIDTAVGIHCGVIRALLGVDLAYAVTEPTPLGAHDLKLILSLLKKIKVPAKIILNQADLGKAELIESLAKKTKTAVKYHLSYSEKLAQAYARGKLKQFKGLR
jgi:MinD superfamily P-loop ATPase